MKTTITFTVNCDNLLAAATLEESLKKMGAEFSFVVNDSNGQRQATRVKGRRRYAVNDEIRAKIKAIAEAHPGATIDKLQKLSGLPHSKSTLGRVLGRHE